jgi:hypothetical protein
MLTLEESKDARLAELQEEAAAKHQELEKAITKTTDEEAAKRKEFQMEALQVTANFLGSMGDLVEAFGKDSVEAAIASRALAAAAAGIFTKALSAGVPPLNYIAAGAVLASGIAAQAKIWSTPLPSAETGGRFLVPDVSGIGRTDGSLLRVNAGEQADITPRGMVGREDERHLIIKMGEQVLYDVVNKGIRSGDIHIYDLAANM